MWNFCAKPVSPSFWFSLLSFPVKLHLLVLELPGDLPAEAGQAPRPLAPVVTHAPRPYAGVKAGALKIAQWAVNPVFTAL